MIIRFIRFFPIPFVVCLIILAALFIRIRRRSVPQKFMILAFAVYWICVVGIMFFPLPVSADWPYNLSLAGSLVTLKNINFSVDPFFSVSTLPYSRAWSWTHILINILLTLPSGIGFVYFLHPSWGMVFCLAIGTGIGLEGAQLLIALVLGVSFHVVDINDVITNAIGVILGGILFKIGRSVNTKISSSRG